MTKPSQSILAITKWWLLFITLTLCGSVTAKNNNNNAPPDCAANSAIIINQIYQEGNKKTNYVELYVTADSSNLDKWVLSIDSDKEQYTLNNAKLNTTDNKVGNSAKQGDFLVLDIETKNNNVELLLVNNSGETSHYLYYANGNFANPNWSPNPIGSCTTAIDTKNANHGGMCSKPDGNMSSGQWETSCDNTLGTSNEGQTLEPYCGSGEVITSLPKIEVSAFTLIDTYKKALPTVVNFTQDFTEPPLVFTLPTTDGGDTAAHRIRNITRSGFEIMTVEPQGEDGPHVAMGLNFLAIEAGRYILPGGEKMEACSFSTTKAQQSKGTHDWESFKFQSSFSQIPVLLGQVQTMLNESGNIPSKPSTPWLTTAISGVTTSDVKMALERSETTLGTLSQAEKIAYLAVEPTSGRKSFFVGSKSIEYEFIRSPEVVEGWGKCTIINYSKNWTNAANQKISPIPLASMNSRGGDSESGEDDGGWFRRCGESVANESARIRLSVDEIRKGNNDLDKNRTHATAERAGIVVFSDNYVTTSVSLDHFELSHSVDALTCAPSDVTLRACKDANCTTLYDGNVSVNLLPSNANSSWSGTNMVADSVDFSGGTINLQLRTVQAGKITLAMSSTPKPTSPLICRSGGVVSDCKINFAAAGLLVTAPASLTANQPSGPVTIQAVKQADSSVNCAPALSGSQKLKLWATYENPSSGTMAVTLNGSALATTPPASSQNVTFDSNAQVTFNTISYPDAGTVRLQAQLDGVGEMAGITLTGDTLLFSRPLALAIFSNDANAACSSGDHTCSAFKAAGDNFNLTVAGVRWESANDSDFNDNAITPNFTGNFSLSHSLIAPNGGNSALIGINSGSISNQGSVTLGQSFSDVGVITISGSASYLGGNLSGTSANIGRFYPASFSLAITNTGEFADTHTGFTYLGESFGYLVNPVVTLNASNSGGVTTSNYHGNFAKLNTANLTFTYPITDSSHTDQNGNNFVLSVTTTPPQLTSLNGVITITLANDSFAYSHDFARVEPFYSDLGITLNPFSDSDGASYSGSTLITPLANRQRFGRAVMVDSFSLSSSGSTATMPLLLEYWQNGLFNPATDDSETLLNSNQLLQLNGDTLAITPASVAHGGNFTLSANGTAATYSFTLDLSAAHTHLRYDWDSNGTHNNDPSAALVLGELFRGNNRFIYLQEQ
ncbi:MAG: hypothetical protein HQL49_03185 [Gammaproteobacteria bacterium]|nr:hypothetical protein [Gammaproteobacteria bacterium]